MVATPMARQTSLYVNLPPPTSAPQGWYQDPQQPEQMRWWDGGSWTEHTQLPLTATSPSSPTPTPTQRIFWTRGRTTAALLVSAVLSAALYGMRDDGPDSIGVLLAAGSMPLVTLVVYLIWSALDRPKPAMWHIVFGGLVGIATTPLYLVAYRLLEARFWFGAGIIPAGLIVLVLAGMSHDQTRAPATVFAVLGALLLLATSPPALFGVYALYRNIVRTAAPTHQAPSDTATPSSYTSPAAGVHPVLSSDSGQTPASKYVAITLFSLAGVLLGLVLLVAVSIADTDPSIVPWMPMFGVILFTPFAVGGLIAWSVYRSKRRR